jgi:hypothetical protein
MPKLSSSSRIFEKRGDPWVSQKEACKEFERTPETEDAEYDFDHRYHSVDLGGLHPTVAPARPEAEIIKQVKAAPETTVEPDYATRIANVRMQYRKKERGRETVRIPESRSKEPPPKRNVFNYSKVPDDKLV